MQYDYIGSPWAPSDSLNRQLCPGGVGNGGTSFRDRAAMINITETFGPVGEGRTKAELVEDMYFCNHVPTSKKPTAEEALRFAQQTWIDGGDLVGFPKPWEDNGQMLATWPSQKDAAEKALRFAQQTWIDGGDLVGFHKP